MAQRRERILRGARELLSVGGFEALNLRQLATRAGVTVPTIYNLIGSKEAVIVALFTAALVEIESRVETHRARAPLELAESLVTESLGLFAEDEDYYRAAMLAVEHLYQGPDAHHAVVRLNAWGERLATAGCAACAEAGLLRRRIPTDVLGRHILRAYRTHCRAWAFRRLDRASFTALALTDVYITLAADAVDTFHATLSHRIAGLAAQAADGPSVHYRQERH
jgi:AcrR family transcriptional regulator